MNAAKYLKYRLGTTSLKDTIMRVFHYRQDGEPGTNIALTFGMILKVNGVIPLSASALL